MICCGPCLIFLNFCSNAYLITIAFSTNLSCNIEIVGNARQSIALPVVSQHIIHYSPRYLFLVCAVPAQTYTTVVGSQQPTPRQSTRNVTASSVCCSHPWQCQGCKQWHWYCNIIYVDSRMPWNATNVTACLPCVVSHLIGMGNGSLPWHAMQKHAIPVYGMGSSVFWCPTHGSTTIIIIPCVPVSFPSPVLQ